MVDTKIIDSIFNKDRPAKLKCGVESKGNKEYIPTQFIRKQEKTYWCSVACIQTLLKFNGVEMEQKEIFSKVSEFSGAVVSNGFRVTAMLTCCDFLRHINHLLPTNSSFISKILSGIRPGQIRLIKNVFLDFYDKVGKNVFAITDSSHNLGHLVLARKISQDEIIIEDPWTGKAYKQNLDVYCNQYRPDPADEYMHVEMLGTIESYDSHEHVFYSANLKTLNSPVFVSCLHVNYLLFLSFVYSMLPRTFKILFFTNS